MKPHVWTVDEITELPEFGSEHGWFYGLVRDDSGRLRLAEVIPGVGWGRPFWRDVLAQPWRPLLDLRRYAP